jgi:hypothetical protein
MGAVFHELGFQVANHAGVDPNLSAFFDGATNPPGMSTARDGLVPGRAPSGGTYVINDRCLLRTQDRHCVVLVTGIVLAQYCTADAWQLLSNGEFGGARLGDADGSCSSVWVLDPHGETAPTPL